MKANDYMRYAATAREISEAIRPKEGDPYKDLANLAVTQINMAASNLRRLGEAYAERERVAATEKKEES